MKKTRPSVSASQTEQLSPQAVEVRRISAKAAAALR